MGIEGPLWGSRGTRGIDQNGRIIGASPQALHLTRGLINQIPESPLAPSTIHYQVQCWKFRAQCFHSIECMPCGYDYPRTAIDQTILQCVNTEKNR